ncbi:hypothetical protein NV226_01560 [Mycoplasma iguanae]|uniref:DUF4231 domain-containing protein n=1 Tax=Mycoplasma iguanae TaxID=292461 RepID=A0ABY5RBI9_9MOLU|nr:hypothetical protein [Mycoplasma iguanae]UVD81975.1 hypothetical protein NV226_01560 [Mycoplasma iguanae]
MKQVDQDLKIYMQQKLRSMEKQKKFAYRSNYVAKILTLTLNLIIIGLAIWALVYQIEIYQASDKKDFINEIGLTFFLALFIVLTFFITLGLSFYSAFMKFEDYKKAINEIEYISILLKEKPDYSINDFEKDLAGIQQAHLQKKKISKKEILIKFIMGEK